MTYRDLQADAMPEAAAIAKGAVALAEISGK